MAQNFKKGFLLMGMGFGFFLWYLYGSIWLFIAMMFIFMGFGVIVDTLNKS
jgi:hypothetical protein